MTVDLGKGWVLREEGPKDWIVWSPGGDSASAAAAQDHEKCSHGGTPIPAGVLKKLDQVLTKLEQEGRI